MAVTLKEDGSTDKKVLGSLTEAVKAQSSVDAEWSRLKKNICKSTASDGFIYNNRKRICNFEMQRESIFHLSEVI